MAIDLSNTTRIGTQQEEKDPLQGKNKPKKRRKSTKSEKIKNLKDNSAAKEKFKELESHRSPEELERMVKATSKIKLDNKNIHITIKGNVDEEEIKERLSDSTYDNGMNNIEVYKNEGNINREDNLLNKEEVNKNNDINSKEENLEKDKNKENNIKKSVTSFEKTQLLEPPEKKINENDKKYSLVRKSDGEVIPINRSIFRIGKDPSFADLCISENKTVSRKHAEINIKNGTVYIKDLQSTNGTFIDGYKILPENEVEVKNEQKIKISNEEFILRLIQK